MRTTFPLIDYRASNSTGAGTEMTIIAPYRGLERPRRLGGTVAAPGGLPDTAHMSRETPSARFRYVFGCRAHFQPPGPLNVDYESCLALSRAL